MWLFESHFYLAPNKLRLPKELRLLFKTHVEVLDLVEKENILQYTLEFIPWVGVNWVTPK